MKSNAKTNNGKITALIFLLTLVMNMPNVYSQTVLSYQLIPATPSTGDNIRIALTTQFNSGDCWLINYTNYISGNTLFLQAYYGTGLAAFICERKDTFTLSGPLPCGSYFVNIYTQVTSSYFASGSANFNFNISCGTPGNLSTTNITGRSARLNWTTTCAYSYQVRYRELNTGGWKKINVSNTTAFVNIKGLKHSKTYEWQIRSKCQVSPDVYSAYSSSVVFSTPAPKLSSLNIYNNELQNTINPEVKISPNPGSGEFFFTCNIDMEKAAYVLYDTYGNKIYSNDDRSYKSGDRNYLNIENLIPGIYLFKLYNSNYSLVSRLVVQ